ncbi:starch binding domain-containing protein [Stylonychia lemnae]|uniref:Starch binding domain-containing protein n=1 Tax=Stylonychia lemnae TaxID=5949 RepID=A0A078BAT1_STYLE|nr:starch binding domain-containing protein [Stylonychia lemnae]|eukprot:CDW91670.1 starch binding domain-containing protein [Stylonychia lemnae]
MGIRQLQDHPVFKADRNRIYDDALNLAISKKQMFKLNPEIIEFRFGQEVYQIGSDSRVGAWNGNHAVRMKWNHGHLWNMQYNKSELPLKFEFKFVIKEGNTIVRWEEGMNHVHDLDKYLEKFKQTEIMKQIQAGKYDEIEIEFEKEKIAYNRVNKVFILHTLWQNK